MLWLTILSILRSIFAAIDRIVAWAIENLYVMIVQLANIRLFDGDVLETFANRINILLGLFMLFWLAFRIVKYVINPDMANDNQQGFGKIILNVVVMLAMLVLVNYGFQAMYGLQNQIFKSDVLPNLIFGMSNRDLIGNDEDSTRQTGKKIGFYIYSAFVYPASGASEPLQTYCENFLSLSGDELGTCLDNVEAKTSPTMADKLGEALSEYNVDKLMSSDLITARDGEKFIMNYTYIISTLCGVVAVIVLVQIAIDVAIRIAKLGLLQLIAPIPIISYIDPISGKNGIFMNWLKEVGKTFASVFIKLASVYFAVFIIMMTVSSHAYMGAEVGGIAANEKITISNHPLLTIMIIIGALLFAKELPKLISQIFGIKLDGGGWGFAKKGISALGAATIGGAAGAIGGGLAGAYAGAKNDGLKGAFKHGFGGMLGAGGRAALAGARGKKLGEGTKGAIIRSNASRNANLAYSKAGYDLGDRIKDQFAEMADIRNDDGSYGVLGQKIHSNEKLMSGYKASEEAYRDYASQIASNNSHLSLDEYDQKYENFKKYAVQQQVGKYDSDGKFSIIDGKEDEFEKYSIEWGGSRGDKAVANYVTAKAKADSAKSRGDKIDADLKHQKAAYKQRNDMKKGGK